MGTISKRAVRRFLCRPLRDSEKAKQFTEDALDRKLSNLDPVPRFARPLKKHQKVSFLLCVKYPRYVVSSDMGLGKTKLMLDVLQYRRRQWGKRTRMLVCVRNVSNLLTWEEETPKDAPALRIASIHAGVPVGERGLLIEDASVHIVAITYAGLCHVVCQRERSRMVIDRKRLSWVADQFDILVMDESTEVRRHDSLPARVCMGISKRVRSCYALTGTIIGRDPQAAWSQFHIADHGQTFGETLGLFRAAFFVEKPNYWSSYPDYEFNRSKSEEYNRMLRHGSIRYAIEECEDLPPVTRTVSHVVFSEDTWAYYDRLIEELTNAKGNFRLVENAYTRLRQLTSGYMKVVGPEKSITWVEFEQNPKLDALVSDLQDVPESQKCIVFHHYTKTGEIIEKRLKREKIGCVRLYGKTRDKTRVLRRFRDDPRVRCIVLNTETGSFSMNLQFARYTFYYESPDDPIVRRQGERRNYRIGQEGTVVYRDYAVRGSIDDRILAAVRSGKRLFDLLVEGKEKLGYAKVCRGSAGS